MHQKFLYHKAMITFLFSFIILPTVWCQQNPIITSITQDVVSEVGQTVNLQCSVQYLRNYGVMWFKKNRDSDLLISRNKQVSFPDRRFSLTSDDGSNTFKLQIQGVTQTDSGVYQCRIQISPSVQISANVQLLVRLQPTISDNSTRSVLKSEGDFVELFCHASGFPEPKITWHRQHNKVLPSGGAIHKGSSLIIEKIQKEHRGTYYCVADNGVGYGARRNIIVNVEFAPVISIPRPDVGQALTYSMNLQCTVEAYPAPSIEWVKDNTLLINNQHYRTIDFATNDQTTDSTLHVITIEKEQYGKYECRAINKLGMAFKPVELYEVFVPQCPPACDVLTTGNAPSHHHFNLAVVLFTSLFIYLCQ